ncbi:hypothetical protein J2S40_000911 [Nocardioides luteus]|uniref:Pyrrolo-quinoline quinone repeat domain-containing protein n=1 Tax=Nocardioides luteus TaxID=1844 RepID=A0ABQ5STI7_9ACTN|nr:PQQ-binding-like beta-propeller repeat protein [Nocardioides luteus]MDR7309853.1 hypothetical protein [Nocardioides luteus]GGR73103.1 hypothetical protein GCM10010197_45540 [Nocardioides luteus]GLJ67239.1 hypothetical protein GCM10017579_12750 [Nocardioides luteus]
MAVSSGAKKALVLAGALIGVAALLVGIGHWRAHDLVAGDVVWHAEVDQGSHESVVVGDRVYTYGKGVLSIRDLSDGRTIAEEYVDGTWALVGDGGHVAVVSIEQITVLDRDGAQMWQRRFDDLHNPFAISRDGELDAVACAEKTCSTVHLDAAGTETSRAVQRRSPRLERPASIGNGTIDDDRVRRIPAFTTDVDPKTHTVREVRDGRPVGTPIRLMDDHVAAQVGDLLVGVDREDGICTFTATQAGDPAWETSTSCPELGFPYVDVFADRIYLSDRTDQTVEVVTTDLDGREANSFSIDAGEPSDARRTELTPTPDAVVLTLTDRVVAYSPTSGKKLWTEKLPKTSRAILDESKRIHPGVSVDGPVVDVYSNAPEPLAALALGRDVPSYTHSFIDAVSGEVTAELAAPWGSRVHGLDDGRVLVVASDDMWLVSP